MGFSKLTYLKELHGVEMKATTFRVLVTVFDYTNEHGRRAFPGNERLARDCCLSVSTVKRALRQLEADCWIQRVQRGGRSGDGAHWSTEYELASTGQFGMSTDQMDTVNGSNGYGQQFMYDPPSDHEPSDHEPSDYESSDYESPSFDS